MKRLYVCALLMAGLVPLWAQSAAVLDDIVASSGVSWAQASYLVLVASGQVDESATPEQTFEVLSQMGWAPWFTPSTAPLTEADLTWLLARAYKLKGGLWFSLMPGPRYAFREFQFRGWVGSGRDPGALVAGNEAIRVLGKVIDATAPAGVKP
ncbi:MAG: hypothetical protein WCG80_00530 [Spirochaetales bacterium]